MKRLFVFLCAMVLVFGLVGTVNASLTTIGTATYMGNDYNLIYEDDSIDGGLVWLDYTGKSGIWVDIEDWSFMIGAHFTVNLDPGYTTTIDWIRDWRLPLTQDEMFGYNQTGSEMGHLYYESLGKPAGGPVGDAHPFNNLQNDIYWSQTDFSLTSNFNDQWVFEFASGSQTSGPKDFEFHALLVCPGTVDAVPIPSAIWLLGSGLIGLVGFRRKLRKEV